MFNILLLPITFIIVNTPWVVFGTSTSVSVARNFAGTDFVEPTQNLT